MHETDDPNMPPPHLLQALAGHSTPTRLVPYVPRKLPDYVIDDICHQIAFDQRAAMVKSEDSNLPPHRLLRVLRKHGRNRPYCPRRLSRRHLLRMPLSQIVELGTAHDIRAVWRGRWGLRRGGLRRMAPSRPSLKSLLVLAAADRKRAGQDVRSIVARLRQLEEDQARRVEAASRQTCYLIDPPCHFASIQEWREFLCGMEEHKDRDHWQISRAIEDARRRVRELEALESTPHLMWWRDLPGHGAG
jgi:hypothetical protein